MKRNNDRAVNEIRKVKITKNYIKYPAGSVLIQMGNTRVICSATLEEKVPPFLRDKNQGWVTAEYSMLPSSTHTRTSREASRGKQSGRTQEIQRLIGRSLRAVVDMNKLGERTIWIDCDVIQADGGTRCASITGAYVAVALAVKKLLKDNVIKENPLIDSIAAVSVGILQGEKLLDLEYEEDSVASVDLNIVKTGSGKYVEIQGTAEQNPFDRKEMDQLLDLGDKGIQELTDLQNAVIGT
jgi:ribonuclease PH